MGGAVDVEVQCLSLLGSERGETEKSGYSRPHDGGCIGGEEGVVREIILLDLDLLWKCQVFKWSLRDDRGHRTLDPGRERIDPCRPLLPRRLDL